MQLQFGLLRGELVISVGIEAWILRDGRWERTDALTAFIKSTQLRPREARRTFGDKLPDVPFKAFADERLDGGCRGGDHASGEHVPAPGRERTSGGDDRRAASMAFRSRSRNG